VHYPIKLMSVSCQQLANHLINKNVSLIEVLVTGNPCPNKDCKGTI